MIGAFVVTGERERPFFYRLGLMLYSCEGLSRLLLSSLYAQRVQQFSYLHHICASKFNRTCHFGWEAKGGEWTGFI